MTSRTSGILHTPKRARERSHTGWFPLLRFENKLFFVSSTDKFSHSVILLDTITSKSLKKKIAK